MFLDKYLSEYDDSISGESYIDPLGMLVIWSAFGQQIFKSRVNSISNDVRNYTLNLFNHYLIRRLIRDDSVVLSRGLVSVYGGKDQLQFKYACLLHLEGLFVYSILKHDGQNDIDSGGVLGITKARRNWTKNNSNPRLVFTHEKESQILVRQLGLGVSGRYKTPLMEIGFFDGNYHYQLPDSAALWEGAEQFIAGTPELRKLADTAFDHLKELLSQNSTKPQTHFSDIPHSLHRAYAAALASPGAVGRYARPYWLSVTGLNTGAARAMLDVLDENAALAKPQDLSPQQLLTKALRKDLLPEEALKMWHIELLEPFLAEVSLLFTLLTTKKAQPISDVLLEWKRFGRDHTSLPRTGQPVRDNLGLIKVLSGTARSRLNKILRLVECKTVEEQVRILTAYHGEVMKERGQSSWLSLNETTRQVKIHVRPSHAPDKDKWKTIHWVNNYYLPQFKSLVFGYQGGSV